MVTGRLYTSTNISVTPCSFVCNRNSLSKKAREKIVDLTSQLLAMPKKGNLLLRSRSGRMVTAEVAKTNPAVGVTLQTLKEAYPDVNRALQKIEKAHSVTKALVDGYCRKQIKKQSRQILEAEAGLMPRSSMENKSGKQILEAEATAKEGAAQEAAPQGHEPKGGNKNERERKKGSDEDEVVEDSLQAELDNLNVGMEAVALDVGWRQIRAVLDDKASDASHGKNWAKQWESASDYTKDRVCELLAKGDKVLLHHMVQVRKKQKPHFLLLHGSEVFDPPANGTCMFACLVRLIQASGRVGLLKHMGVTKHLPQGKVDTTPYYVMAKLMKVAQPLIFRFERSMSKGKARRYLEGEAEALSEDRSISSQGGSKRRSGTNKDSDSQGQVKSGLDIQIQKLMHGQIDHLACCDGEWLHGYLGCNRFHSSGLGDWKDNAALGEWEYNAFGGDQEDILEAEDKEKEEIEAPRGNEPASQLNQPAEAAERSMNQNGTRRSPRSSIHDTMSMHSLLETLKWQDCGHEWLNKRVVRDYGAKGSNQGRITKWIPADPKFPEENMALWHVMFDDDDEEDLDQGEVEEALLLEELRVKKTQLASTLIKQAAAKKAAKEAAAKEAAKQEAAKQEAAKQEAAKQEAAKQEAAEATAKEAEATAKQEAAKRAKQQRKRKREKTHPIKTAEVVTDEQIEANILSWLNPLKDPYAKPKDKNIAALAALELKRMPKTKTQVDAACRRASKKYHPDKIPADFSDSMRELYTEAFKGLVQVKELVMNKINK